MRFLKWVLFVVAVVAALWMAIELFIVQEKPVIKKKGAADGADVEDIDHEEVQEPVGPGGPKRKAGD